MENRSGLVVGAVVTLATGKGDREAALAQVEALPGKRAKTVGPDKAYDTRDFVAAYREPNVTPHVAQNLTPIGGTAIDGRTTRGRRATLAIVSARSSANASRMHFGWGKMVGRIRQTVVRGLQRVDLLFKLKMAASNLSHIARLLSAAPQGTPQ